MKSENFYLNEKLKNHIFDLKNDEQFAKKTKNSFLFKVLKPLSSEGALIALPVILFPLLTVSLSLIMRFELSFLISFIATLVFVLPVMANKNIADEIKEIDTHKKNKIASFLMSFAKKQKNCLSSDDLILLKECLSIIEEKPVSNSWADNLLNILRKFENSVKPSAIQSAKTFFEDSVPLSNENSIDLKINIKADESKQES